MRRIFAAWRLMLLLALLAMSAIPRGALAADRPVVIRINAPGLVGLAPLFLALDKGYFAAEGLDVQIADGVAKNGGMEIVAALNDRSLDIATIAPSAPLFDAIAHGSSVTGLHVLNTVTPSDMSSGIIVRQDLVASGRYKSAQDLEGMTIAVGALGSTSHYNVIKALAQAGVRPAGVSFVVMPFAAALKALEDKSIDAAFEVEPFISAAAAHATARLVVPSSQTSPGAASVMVYGNSSFVAAHRRAVEGYVYALMRGQRDYLAAISSGTGKAALEAVLVKYTSVKDLQQIRQMHLPTVDPDGALDVAAMAQLQQFFLVSGGLRSTLAASQIIDPRFTAIALKRLGTIGH